MLSAWQTRRGFMSSASAAGAAGVPKENFGVSSAALPGSFYKRDGSLPAEMRYFDGQPPDTLRFGSAWPQGDFTWITETTEVAPGFHLILLKGSWGVDLDVMEISLAIDTPDGIVLVVGCSHPTLEKIVEAARSATGKPVHLVLGGTHLLPATPGEITRVATALRDESKVAWIPRYTARASRRSPFSSRASATVTSMPGWAPRSSSRRRSR